MVTSVVDAAAEVAEFVEANADEAARLRRLPGSTVEALASRDLMRMCVPQVYGGPEAPAPDLLRAVMALAAADGAAGWCSMIASTTSSMSAFLPAEGAREIYGDPSVVTGGVFAPNGTGTVATVDGVVGVQVSGRWAWGSGTQHCEWILGGAACDDQSFRLCWFPSAAVVFHDTWHTGGMRGSGSLDFSVDEAFAPDHRTMRPGVSEPVVDCALAHFPNFALLAASVAAVGLGVARHALDELIELAAAKTPQFSRSALADNSFTRIEVARAEGSLRSARAFLLDEVSRAWEAVETGSSVSLERRTAIRLAAVHAATAAADVADTAYTLAGGSAVYDTSVLGRCLRDAHVVTQHIQTAPKLLEKIGALIFGRDADTSMF